MRESGPASKNARRGLASLLATLLAHRALPTLGALLAVGLTLPALGYGLAWDDFMLDESLARSGSLGTALVDTYVFVTHDAVAGLKDEGTLPWWAPDRLRFAFFRPLASLTLWLDFALWPDSPPLRHAHSIAWYALAVFVAGLLYRTLAVVPWAGGLALLLFVFDDAHGIPVAWLALRNGLVALVFGCACILLHVRHRRDGARAAGGLAAVCFALALLAAELGISAAAYLFAYALLLDPAPVRSRAASLAPYAVIACGWWLGYTAFGFGVEGSGAYSDPLADPGLFLSGLVEGVPLVLLGQLGWVDVNLYNAMQLEARAFWHVVAFGFTVLLAAVFWPLLRREPAARFWATGMLLATVPVCISRIHSPRLWLFVGLGAMGLVAEWVAGLVERRAWLPQRAALRAPLWGAAGVLLVVHGLLGPYQLWSELRNPVMQPELDVLLRVDTFAEIAGRDVVIVNAPSPFHLYYLYPVFRERQKPLPASFRVLAPGYAAVDVERVDANTLRVRPEHGLIPEPGVGEALVHPAYWFQTLATMYRAPDDAIDQGTSLELRGQRVRIEEALGGNPTAIEFRFDAPLEDPRWVWLQYDWQHRVYAPFEPPPPGDSVRVGGGV